MGSQRELQTGLSQHILSLCANNADIACIRTRGKDFQYEVSYVNKAWEDLTGYSQDAIIGKKYGSSVLKGRETNSRVTDKIRRCIKEKIPFFGDVINYKKDGTKFINRLSIVPLPNGDFVGTCMDVSTTHPQRNRQSMKRLRREDSSIAERPAAAGYPRDTQRGRKRSLNGSSPTVLAQSILTLCAKNSKIAFIRTNGRHNQYTVSYVNKAWENLTGYCSADIVGQKHGSSILKGKETCSPVTDRIRRCIQELVPFFGDVVNYKKDGTKFVNRLSIIPLPNGDFIGTCQDASTDTKSVATPYSDAAVDCGPTSVQSDFSNLACTVMNLCANNKDVAFIRTKGKGKQYEVSFVNEAWEQLTGYNRSAIIGRKYGSSMLKGRETQNSVTDKIRRCVQKEIPFFGDVINYKKDGTKFINRLSIIPLPNGDFIGTCMDASVQESCALSGIAGALPDSCKKRRVCAGSGRKQEITPPTARLLGSNVSLAQHLRTQQDRPQGPILDAVSDGAGGQYYVSACGVHHVSMAGHVVTIAGNGSFQCGDRDGAGGTARFRTLCGITVSTDGQMLYVTDNGNHKIKQVCLSTGVVTSIAGTGKEGDEEGVGGAAGLRFPHGIVASMDGLSVYFTDLNQKVKRLELATRNVTTVAGSASGDRDGVGSAARFNCPFGIRVGDATEITVDEEADCEARRRCNEGEEMDGRKSNKRAKSRSVLIIADCGNNKVKQLDLASLRVTTLKGGKAEGRRNRMGAWYYLKGGFK